MTDEQKYLIKEIFSTKDHARRDEIALMLSDQGVVELIPIVISLLFREDTKNYRSTLIYCLGRYSVFDFSSQDFYFLSVYEKTEDNYGCQLELKSLTQQFLEEQ